MVGYSKRTPNWQIWTHMMHRLMTTSITFKLVILGNKNTKNKADEVCDHGPWFHFQDLNLNEM